MTEEAVGWDAVLYTFCDTSGSLPLELSHVMISELLDYASSGLSLVCSTTPLDCGALVILPEDPSCGQAIDTQFVVMVLNLIRHSPMMIARQVVYLWKGLILASHGPSPKWCSNLPHDQTGIWTLALRSGCGEGKVVDVISLVPGSVSEMNCCHWSRHQK